jgi:hypothetical protein
MTEALIALLVYGLLGMAALSWVGVLPARSALPQIRRDSPDFDAMANLAPALLAIALALISLVYLALWPLALAWELWANGLPRRGDS